MSNQNKLSLKCPFQEAAEYSGAGGKFRCHSLRRSKIFRDL
jgi:hypothetical protein